MDHDLSLSHVQPRIPCVKHPKSSHIPEELAVFVSPQDLLPVLLQNLLLGSWNPQMLRLASREISLLTMLRLGGNPEPRNPPGPKVKPLGNHGNSRAKR